MGNSLKLRQMKMEHLQDQLNTLEGLKDKLNGLERAVIMDVIREKAAEHKYYLKSVNGGKK